MSDLTQNQKRDDAGGMRQFPMIRQSITMQPNGLRHLTMIGAARGFCAQNTHLPPWPLNSINE